MGLRVRFNELQRVTNPLMADYNHKLRCRVKYFLKKAKLVQCYLQPSQSADALVVYEYLGHLLGLWVRKLECFTHLLIVHVALYKRQIFGLQKLFGRNTVGTAGFGVDKYVHD
jgi:hypothetical protein